MNNKLKEIQDKFIQEWGSVGSAWGINKTMAQINGLLWISSEPLNTDQIMERIDISRGNAHKNIKELLNFGIAKPVIIKGDRKEYFTSIKDPWTLFKVVMKERKKREMDPMLEALDSFIQETKGLKGKEEKEFHDKLKEMKEFSEIFTGLVDKLSNFEKDFLIKYLIDLLVKM